MQLQQEMLLALLLQNGKGRLAPAKSSGDSAVTAAALDHTQLASLGTTALIELDAAAAMAAGRDRNYTGSSDKGGHVQVLPANYFASFAPLLIGNNPTYVLIKLRINKTILMMFLSIFPDFQ